MLTAAGHPNLASGAREEGREYLVGLLFEGPKTSREIWEDVEERGLSVRTINRAKDEMGIRSSRVWIDRKQLSFWLMKDQKLPGTVPAEARPADLEPYLEPLRKEFPPPTPLDDM